MKFTFVESVGKQKLLRNEKTVDFIDDTGVEDQVINIYPQIKYQTFEGFGGAITDAAGYVFQQMNDVQQKELLTKYFDPDHMNYVRVRIHMDSCDFSTHLYSAIKTRRTEIWNHLILRIQRNIFCHCWRLHRKQRKDH